MAEKRELKRGEKKVWIIEGEITKPILLANPGAYHYHHEIYDTKADAERALKALKKSGKYTYTSSRPKAGTTRTLRRTSHNQVLLRKNWRAGQLSKTRKMLRAGEARDERVEREKILPLCEGCGREIQRGSTKVVFRGKQYHWGCRPPEARR
jgi:hypothetical protein